MEDKLVPGNLFKVELSLDVYAHPNMRRMILLEESTILMVLRSIEEARSRGTIDGWYSIMSMGMVYHAWGTT